jgi:exosortase A-associated hydrolase 2
VTADGENVETPLFLDSAAGRVFALYCAPKQKHERRPAIVYLPPFAEEMNRSRRMAALQARALAASGYGVMLLDPFGTGDSDGDFRDARVSLWLEDVAAAADWLERKGHDTIELWGLRFGALLAAAATARAPARFSNLLLWQPATDGRTLMTQFLRIGLAASLADRGERLSTESLRGRLREGRSIEIAGYELMPELAAAIEDLKFSDFDMPASTRIRWFEVAPDTDEALTPASTKIVEHLREMGRSAVARKVMGPQFWLTAEITTAPALIEATKAALAPPPAR